MYIKDKVEKALEYIKNNISEIPEILFILGSGIIELPEKEIKIKKIIPYSDIPYWPQPTTKLHKGNLIFAESAGRNIVIMQGRVHYYEGYSIEEVAFPVRVLASLGIKCIFVTSASGGVSEKMTPGTLMFINDHINYMGNNPLIGPNNQEWGERYPDMTYTYDRESISLLKEIVADKGIKSEEGVYMAFTGPSFETPAEIRMARCLGADSVGMSTVPEVIVARHMGVRIVALTCISNFAAGITENLLTEEEVKENMSSFEKNVMTVIVEFIKRYR